MKPVGMEIKQPWIKSGFHKVKNSLSILWWVHKIPKLSIAVVAIDTKMTNAIAACFFVSLMFLKIIFLKRKIISEYFDILEHFFKNGVIPELLFNAQALLFMQNLIKSRIAKGKIHNRSLDKT